jgi:hypothetical protein
MKTIALIDIRSEVPGVSLGILVSMHDTVLEAFAANDAFQQAEATGRHIRTKSSLQGNEVIHNDLILNPMGCPGQPPFETLESEDCDEGIHLMMIYNHALGNNKRFARSTGRTLQGDTCRIGPERSDIVEEMKPLRGLCRCFCGTY